MISSVGVRVFFTITSGENLKFPNGVFHLVDATERKIPLHPGVPRFLVFKIPVFNPTLTAVFGTSFGLGPNFCLSKIKHLDPRTLFAASHTLVAGHTVKVALW